MPLYLPRAVMMILMISSTLISLIDKEVHPMDPYTHAVILGGTNDLAVEHPVSEIWRALEEVVWNLSLLFTSNFLGMVS
jgi:hypothetical protein